MAVGYRRTSDAPSAWRGRDLLLRKRPAHRQQRVLRNAGALTDFPNLRRSSTALQKLTNSENHNASRRVVTNNKSFRQDTQENVEGPMKQLVRTLLLGTAMIAGSATWAAA